MKFFKKKKAPVIEEKKVEEKSFSLTDFYKALGIAIESNKVSAEDKFKQLFPRTIENIVPQQIQNGKVVSMDSDFNYYKHFENEIPYEILSFLNERFIGYQAMSVMSQNPFINRACSIPGKDAIAPDFVLSYINNEDKKADEETQDIDELKLIKEGIDFIKNICVKHETNKRKFGYSIVIPIVDGVDYEKPFNIDGIKQNSFKGLQVIEPFWVRPELDFESASDPTSSYYFVPTWYVINGKRVHRSWVLRSVYCEVPDLLKPTYYFGGLSLTQQIYERVYCADKVSNEAPMLAQTKRLLVIDANVSELIANPTEASQALKALNECRDNFGVYVKNPGDQVIQLDTALADFDALIMTQYQLVSAIAGIPATKLLKTTPKGFNATGEFEDKDYKQSLLDIQENDFIPLIKFILDIYTKSKFGRVIELDVKFNPIDTPSELEKAQVEQIQTNNAVQNINAGITSPEEEREILRMRDGSAYSGLKEEMEEPDFEEELNEEETTVL